MAPAELAPLLGIVDDIPGLYRLIRSMFEHHHEDQTNPPHSEGMRPPHSPTAHGVFHHGASSPTDDFLYG